MNKTNESGVRSEKKTLRGILHLNAKQQLQVYVKEIVSSTMFEDGTVDVPFNLVTKIKQMGGIVGLDSIDLLGFYVLSLRIIYKSVIGLQIDEHSNGCLKDLTQPDKLEEISSRLFEAILDLPKEYEVRISLPGLVLTNKEPLVLNDCIRIITKEEEDFSKAGLGVEGLYGHLFSGTTPKSDVTYLCISVRGIAYNGTSCQLFQAALSIVKQFIAAALIFDTFKEETGRALALRTELSPHFAEPKCSIYDVLNESENPLAVEIPVTERLFLSKLELGERFLKDTDNPQKQQRLQKEAQAFSYLFRDRTDDEKIDNEAGRVRTALEWFFNALANDNQTFAHVQLCIAMEALLGERNERDNIMDRLSNRCAFLIGRNPIERRMMKKRVEDAYDMRSRIVHRGEIKLSLQDSSISHSFRTLLRISLRKEISGIAHAIEHQLQPGQEKQPEIRSS